MVIANNVSANMILGHLNRNINKKSKASQQLALAEKVCNAGDDASTYAISEKMRVSIRALNQADANVQNGASMLKVAEGAIQSQINLLRTVKERVINAHNDTNTDADRLIIQKEITNYYNEINDIAAETTFNGKHLLLGNKVQDSVKSWFKLDHAEKLEGSDTLGLISGTYSSLDGTDGPFSIFGTESNKDGYSIETGDEHYFNGGTDDKARIIGLDFNDDSEPDDLVNKAFKVIYPGGEQIFVFTYGTGESYSEDNVHEIDLNSQISVSKVIKNVLTPALAEYVNIDYDAEYQGSRRITLTTLEKGEEVDSEQLYNVVGVELHNTSGTQVAYKLPDSMITAHQQHGADGKTAAWEWSVASYGSNAEKFISDYVGQAITHSGNLQTYEFIDSSKSPTVDSITKINGSIAVDLNAVRTAVSGGQTVAEAFASIMTSRMGSSLVETLESSGQVTGIKIKATVRGETGNTQKITFEKGNLRDYTIDFKSLFNSKGIADGDIAGALDGKGFRFYDATNKNQWVNVLFVNGINPNDDERPASGTADLDIDTLVVDLSDVTNFNSFMKTLYQGDGDKNPRGLSQFLESSSQNFRLAADFTSGTITIYDSRKDKVWTGQTDKGAKIADGIVDNVVNDYRNTYANDLVIQHTDKSSANIHVIIPQTTMDHIFGYKVGAGSLDDYSVLTSEKREMLLGRDTPVKEKGALDKGLQYLIDANTLIGAQINHMENADANLVTVVENTTAAESVMRDADMAKSAMDLAKYNILSQATSAMLSQFNHNSADVLGLLQQ